MKKVKKKNLRSIDKIIVASVALVLIAITAIATKFALGAVDASISATITPSTLNTEQQAVVTVMGNSGSQGINVARARVTYDTTKWQYVATDFTGTPFEARTPEPPAHQGPGYYEITGYKISPPHPTGDFLIGKLILKAIGTASTTAINVDKANSELYSADDATKVLGSVTGTVATINTPAANPSPTPTPSNPPASGRTSSGNSSRQSSGAQSTPGTGDDTSTGTTENTTTNEPVASMNDDSSSTNQALAKQAAQRKQSNLSRYKTPILVAGLGILLAAGATYGVMVYLHNRNHTLGTVATASSNGLSGAVIGSGLYGPQAGAHGADNPVNSDQNDLNKN